MRNVEGCWTAVTFDMMSAEGYLADGEEVDQRDIVLLPWWVLGAKRGTRRGCQDGGEAFVSEVFAPSVITCCCSSRELPSLPRPVLFTSPGSHNLLPDFVRLTQSTEGRFNHLKTSASWGPSVHNDRPSRPYSSKEFVSRRSSRYHAFWSQ